MFNYINSLDSSSLIYLAKQYANLDFTKQEIDPILPFLKSVYIDYCKNKDKVKFLEYAYEIYRTLEMTNYGQNDLIQLENQEYKND